MATKPELSNQQVQVGNSNNGSTAIKTEEAPQASNAAPIMPKTENMEF